MAQMIDAERLKQLRTLRGFTQEELAQRGRVNKQTVYRLEKGKKAGRPRTHGQLAQALGVHPEVLTGEKPIPSEISQPSATTADEAAYQLNVRVDAAVRNAFELVARRYRISVPKIAQLAPLLLVIIAEGSLRHRRENLDELKAALRRLYEFEDISSKLQSKFPHIPFPNIDWEDQDEAIKAEELSIERRDLFAQGRFDPYGSQDENEDNPFTAYLKGLTAGYDDDITIRSLGPTSTEYRVCRSEAIELTESDEYTERLLDGEVPIHRMPRDLKTVEERVKWMHDHKISVHKVPEEPPSKEDAAKPLNLEF